MLYIGTLRSVVGPCEQLPRYHRSTASRSLHRITSHKNVWHIRARGEALQSIQPLLRRLTWQEIQPMIQCSMRILLKSSQKLL